MSQRGRGPGRSQCQRAGRGVKARHNISGGGGADKTEHVLTRRVIRRNTDCGRGECSVIQIADQNCRIDRRRSVIIRVDQGTGTTQHRGIVDGTDRNRADDGIPQLGPIGNLVDHRSSGCRRTRTGIRIRHQPQSRLELCRGCCRAHRNQCQETSGRVRAGSDIACCRRSGKTELILSGDKVRGEHDRCRGQRCVITVR